MVTQKHIMLLLKPTFRKTLQKILVTPLMAGMQAYTVCNVFYASHLLYDRSVVYVLTYFLPQKIIEKQLVPILVSCESRVHWRNLGGVWEGGPCPPISLQRDNNSFTILLNNMKTRKWLNL